MTVFALLGVLATGGAPSAGSSAESWQLEFSFHDPQRLTLTLPGQSEPTSFWYVLYTVTNNTGRDVQFFPSFKLVTDTLNVVTAGDYVNPDVYDVIKARHKKEFPFFVPPTKITGLLLQGADNARTSVAVFRTFDPKADAFTIYASGLSGEITRMVNPAFEPGEDESEDNPRFFILRRTLAIHYALPGEPDTRHLVTPVRKNREWILR